jgi:hypothetical protein
VIFISSGCGNCEVSGELHPFKSLAIGLALKNNERRSQQPEVTRGSGVCGGALGEPSRPHGRASGGRLPGFVVLRGAELEVDSPVRASNSAGTSGSGQGQVVPHVRDVWRWQFRQACVGPCTGQLPAPVHPGSRDRKRADLYLRLHRGDLGHHRRQAVHTHLVGHGWRYGDGLQPGRQVPARHLGQPVRRRPRRLAALTSLGDAPWKPPRSRRWPWPAHHMSI